MTATQANQNIWLHRFAILTAVMTLPLIFIGGLVTSHDAAMAVPDWPTTYGYNMFLFPWQKWVGGIFYEHTHRLVASFVGFLTLILTTWLLIAEDRKWMKKLGFVTLLLVILQGVLGGLRVILAKKGIAIFHACLAQAFFCLVTAIALFTSSWWKKQMQNQSVFDSSQLRKLSVVMTAIIFGQLILGATMRHTDSGLAVPDFPMIYGRLVPPLTAGELQKINETRVWNPKLEPVTFGQIAIHLAHRLGALIVTVSILMTVWIVFRHHRNIKPLILLARILVVLLILQLVLGPFVVWTGKAADIATAHVAVGALTLVSSFLFTLIAFKMFAIAGVEGSPLCESCSSGADGPRSAEGFGEARATHSTFLQ